MRNATLNILDPIFVNYAAFGTTLKSKHSGGNDEYLYVLYVNIYAHSHSYICDIMY